ncbi:unnamed protein product [Schistosoma curassoni]|uniref:Ig-like domain-containing protein n=1 Tax=Schistosoma curassoni TaxID=6186 RepID=A0A183JBN7_9TREM|nr:unnamed protein product [Schistosoma curassoni]
MPPSIAYINPEEPLLIPCYAKANPEPRYYWTLNGKQANWIKPYNTMLSKKLTHSNDSYHLHSMDESGLWYFGIQRISNHLIAGLYQCIAINPFGKALSIPLKLEVASNLHLFNINSFTKRNLTYTCVINHLILHTMKTGPDIKLLFDSNTLATNEHVNKELTKIKKRSILYHSSIQQIVLLNESLSIKCVIHGNPLPNIHWEFMMAHQIDSNGDSHQYKDVKLVKLIIIIYYLFILFI